MKNYVANKGEETAVSIEEYLRMDNPKMTFNEDSVLLLGGTPMTVRLPPEVSTVNYTGCIDGLQVNHHFIGTWNSELSWPLTVSRVHIHQSLTHYCNVKGLEISMTWKLGIFSLKNPRKYDCRFSEN